MRNTTPEKPPASCIDHTLLKPTTTLDQIAVLCEEAVEFGFAAVCVPPVFVKEAAQRVYGSGVDVATVIGFPCGYGSTESKVFEVENTLINGATELDMVLHLGAVMADEWALVYEDIAAVTRQAGEHCVKVILECCYLSKEQKRKAGRVAIDAGAAYLKTSTGFGTGGATVEDVRLLAEVAGSRASVKASGGIRTWAECQKMLDAGANRIGTSSGVEIIRQWQQDL